MSTVEDVDVKHWAWDLAVGGVNHSIPGNGGDDCKMFMPYWQRMAETAVVLPLCCSYLWHTLPSLSTDFRTRANPTSRYTVLTLYSLVFGAELAFKMISRTAIFLMNPCHITTVLQLALLSMDPSQPLTCLLFRLQLYLMPGAFFALKFPILNTRLLPGEVFIYYVQHIAIVTLPIYLMHIRGAFEPEPTHDLCWPLVSMLLIAIYHFLPLQFMALYANVNLNNILCPAISDPFGTRFYRIFAIGHQFLLVPLIAKLYSCLANVLISGLETCMVALPLNEKCDRPTMLSLTPEKCGFAVVCQERSSPTTPLILCAEKNGKAE